MEKIEPQYDIINTFKLDETESAGMKDMYLEIRRENPGHQCWAASLYKAGKDGMGKRVDIGHKAPTDIVSLSDYIKAVTNNLQYCAEAYNRTLD